MKRTRKDIALSNTVVLVLLAAAGCAVDQPADPAGSLAGAHEDQLARKPPPRGVPKTPAIFDATILSTTSVRLTWTDVTNETEFHLDRGVNVDCGDGSGPNCVDSVTFAPIPANTLTFTDHTVTSSDNPNVPPHGSYTWRLQACNVQGCSEHAYADAFIQGP